MKNFTKSSRVMPKAKWLAAAALALALSAMLSLMWGASGMSLPALWHAFVTGDTASTAGRIFWFMRLPRTAACVFAGAGLAVAGAVLQAVLANPLAAPNIIGVNSGAALAVTIACIGNVGGWVIAGAAFGGAMGAVFLVVLLARLTGASRLTLVLSGVAMNALLNAASETIRTFFTDAAISTIDFKVGGFSTIASDRLWPAAILIGLALVAVFFLSNELDVLSMGETTAHGLGMPVKRYRTLLLALAALLAGASVSFCGLLGFVGLIIPHLARQLVGSDSRVLLPMSALSGGALVTLCDLAARTILSPYELPAGTLLAFIGVPCFLVILLRQRGGRIHA